MGVLIMSFFSSIFRSQMPNVLVRLQDIKVDLNTAQISIKHLIELEEELSKKEEEFQQSDIEIERAIDNFGVALWLKDLNSRFLYVNKVCCETILKCTQEEALGLRNGDLKKDAFAQVCMQSDNKIMESQTTRRFIEYATLENGKQIWIDTLKSPVFDNKSRIIQIMGNAIDITHNVPDIIKQSHGKTGSIEISINETLSAERYIELLERRKVPRDS